MTCIYNPDDITKATLKNYENILGSYEAAYYVLSQNNGFSLDMTPEGKPSALYARILSDVGNDAEAIKQKAIVYTSTFLKKYGDWTVDPASVDPSILDSNNEPKYSFLYGTRDEDLDRIMNNLFLSDGEFGTQIKELSAVEPTDEEESYAVSQILQLSLRNFIAERLREFKQNNPNATQDQINKERVRAQRTWYDTKARSILNEQKLSLATAFGLKYVQRPNGQIELVSTGEEKGLKNLRIKFVQNVDNDPLEDELLGLQDTNLSKLYTEKVEGAKDYIHDGLVSRRKSDRMLSASALIYLSLNEGSAITLSKTLAYHYITMMIDNDMIQLALKSFDDTGDRSTLYLVNKLVDAITEPLAKNKNGVSLIDQALTGDISKDQQKQLEFFNDFWNNFDKLKDDIINKGVTTEDARQKLLSVVAASIALNEQHQTHIQRSAYFNYDLGPIDNVMDLYSTKYKPDVLQIKKELSDEQKFFNMLEKAYENRVERMRRRNDPDSTQNKTLATLINLQELRKSNVYNELDQKKIIEDLFKQAAVEVKDAYDELYNLRQDPASTVSQKAKYIINAYNETVSYYNTLIGNLLDPLFDKTNGKYDSLKDFRASLMGLIRDLQNNYNDLLLDTTSQIIDDWVDKYAKDGLLSTKDKINMKANYKAWLKNQSQFGDVRIYEPWITMNSSSRSGVIRIALNIIQKANRSREQDVDEKAAQLGRLFEKVKKRLIKQGNGYAIGSVLLPGVNFQELFQERDAVGKPTGYFSRKYNFGLFYQLRNQKIESVVQQLEQEVRNDTGNIHFEFERDGYGQPIFPEEDFYEKYWRKYELAMNDFDCTYGNKQFKKEYYEMRINNLSRTTIQMQDEIQEKINAILMPVTQDGIPHIEKLARQDRSTVYQLRKEQDNLSNEYDIITGEKKQGDKLKAARELKAFHQLTKDRVLYEERTIDDGNGNQISLYQHTLDSIPDSQKDIFRKMTSTKEINPIFWEIYKKMQEKYKAQFPDSFKPIFEQISKLTEEKFDILNLVKDRGWVLPDLTMLKDPSWSRIKQIDEEVYTLYEPIQQWIKSQSSSIPSAAKILAQFLEIPSKNDNRVSQFSEYIRQALQEDADESAATGTVTYRHYMEAAAKYTIDVTYVDQHGSVNTIKRPLSVFNYMDPIMSEGILLNNGVDPSTYTKTVIKPNAEFNKPVHPSDPRYNGNSLVNEDYDPNYDAFIQPKMLNNQFNTINDNAELMELYNALVETMQEANEMIPAVKASSKYRLPQMRGDSQGLLGRRLSQDLLHAPKQLGANLQYIFDSMFGVNETDEDINDDFTTMPDGSRVNSLPVRFIKMLEKPEYITRDVLGSVLSYYSMALNYKYKAEIEPLLLSLLNQVGQDQTIVDKSDRHNVHVIHGSKTNQYAKLKDIIDTEEYGQEQYFGERGENKLSTSEKRALKISKQVRTYGIFSALARNTFSQSTGLLDALTESAVFAVTGDLFNRKDYAEAIALLSGNGGAALRNLGRNVASGKVVALMRKNGLSKDPSRLLKDSHHTKTRRAVDVLTNPMGVFRLADYTVDAITMTAAYLNMRFSNKYNTFLSEKDFIGRYIKDGYTKEQAESEYSKAKKMYFCYKEVDGVATLDKDISNKMNPENIEQLEKEIATSLKTWVPKFNGAVADEDKALLQKNIYGSFITALRTYLINKSQTLFATGDDFIDEENSKRKLDALKAKYKKLYKARKSIKSETKRQKQISKLREQISSTEDELYKIYQGQIDKIQVNKELVKPAAINATATAFSTYAVGQVASLISPTLGTIVYGAGALGTILSSAYVYYNTKKMGTAEAGLKINRIEQLETKLIALKQALETLLQQRDVTDIDTELYSLSKQIEDVESSIRNSRGFYDFSRNIVTDGHARCWFNALQNMFTKIKWYTSVMFRPNYKNTHYKPNIDKMSPQMKAGFSRINTQLATLFILWLTSMFLLCGYRDNNMEDFVPGKIPVVGKYIKSAAEGALDIENKVLYDAFQTLVENKQWEQAWGLLHESSTEGVLSAVPLANHYAEAIADDMLGYRKTVKRSTGEVVRKQVEDKVQSRVEAAKSVLALQAIRLFGEQATTFDINTVNDLFSSVSSPMNVNFKTFDETLHFTQASLDGTLQNYVQRASWQGYFTKGEYIVSNALAPIGVPQAWKSWKKAGRDASMQYRLGLGGMPILFPKPTAEINVKKKSTKLKNPNKKSGKKKSSIRF